MTYLEINGHDIPWPDEAPGEFDVTPDAPVLVDGLLTRSDLNRLPNPEPLIDNVLDLGTIALLYGPWGVGKSFIGFDWAASAATARPWQGRATRQRKTLYVAAEGAFGFKGRADAWEMGWNTMIPDGALDILPTPVNLTRSVDVANLEALIDWNGYGFVVLDTLARCMVGGDENSAQDCGLVVDVLHRLRQRTPAGRGVILGVHHTGKDGKTFRGSSAFEAGADTVYSVAMDGGVIVLDRQKRKDGPRVDLHRLKLDPIEGTGSVVVGKSHDGGTETAADLLLSHFVSHFAATGARPTQLREVVEIPKSTFYRALSELVERGDLINEGTDKLPFYRVATK